MPLQHALIYALDAEQDSASNEHRFQRVFGKSRQLTPSSDQHTSDHLDACKPELVIIGIDSGKPRRFWRDKRGPWAQSQQCYRRLPALYIVNDFRSLRR